MPPRPRLSLLTWLAELTLAPEYPMMFCHEFALHIVTTSVNENRDVMDHSIT